MSYLRYNGQMITNEGKYTNYVVPPIAFNDWFLPSKEELGKMGENLHAFVVGNFATDEAYWSSSEYPTLEFGYCWIYSMPLFEFGGDFKNVARNVRACRTFIDSIGAYSLRDEGPGGGLIFYIDASTT